MVPSLITDPSITYLGGAFRIKERKGRKLHVTLQASSTPQEHTQRPGSSEGPSTHLKLPREVDAPTASGKILILSCPIPIIPTQTGSTDWFHYVHHHLDTLYQSTGLI